jgi:hypothetical protein
MTKLLALVGLAFVAGHIAADPPSTSLTPVQAADAPFDLAAAVSGGRVEWASSEYPGSGVAMNLIGPTRYAGWVSDSTLPPPHEIVFSFFSRASALVARIEINPITRLRQNRTKDIEIWTSAVSATEAFSKVAAATLAPQDALQSVVFEPVEARFVKLRVMSGSGPDSEHAPFSAGLGIGAGRVRILEGRRDGYVPLRDRLPELAAAMRGVMPDALPAPALASTPTEIEGVCTVAAPRPPWPPNFPQSRQVLIVASDPPDFRAVAWKSSVTDVKGMQDRPVVKGVDYTWVTPDIAAPAHLVSAPRVDTVVLSQTCAIKDKVASAFKEALVAWVSTGHKLIIQDSDYCAGHNTPDYSFLPFPFATINPGAFGANGEAGVLENSTLASDHARDAAFIDTAAWKAGNNDLGDSNVIVRYDRRWCGAMWARNKLRKNGFALAYARHGRGLIIYDGFDRDQFNSPIYAKLVTRELLQPFDGDGLPCSQPLGDFIIASGTRLKSQPMAARKVFSYPITIAGNHGYTGRISLEASVVPADPAVSVTLDSTVADLTSVDEASTSLTVTTGASASLTSKVISVRGRDASGTSNVLCLQLPERTGGSMTVRNGLHAEKPPTKNLEIILDASGSMNALLGKKTRWATAQEVLKDVVSKLPKDFSVGLRAYGHTLASSNPNTCVDSALIVPVARLDPAALLGAARRLTPRGETPLVYSILQTPNDLKAVKGGTVVLITDGEESCKGDFAAAARALKESGLTLTLNIVGFTLKNVPAQAQLSGLAASTGGRYYSAQSGAALGRALLLAAVDRLPYRVIDGSGTEVASGEAGDGEAHELPPGPYTVVVHAGEEILKVPVSVDRGVERSITVVVKDDKLAIE